MPPKPTVEKEEIIGAAVEILRESGIEAINARALAKKLGCSTGPLFRVYKNMQELTDDVIAKIDSIYDDFMSSRMTDTNRLVSQGIGYVEFAREEKNMYMALFMNKRIQNYSLEDVINAEWNRETIENVMKITGLSMKKAESVFVNVWLYSCGLAAQIISNDMALPPQTVAELTENAFERFAANL